ncbi:hypothetical protein E8E13_006703 [Curvularia kusanoi]|uniref:Uncharacterized protein n=1 Tax=Curvularia kusanoi TaxID=90978 RepID=A0A9P4TD18_CURKU|nr:hypothetical protein E8E13_006703 [Curvularia kusanoi]
MASERPTTAAEDATPSDTTDRAKAKLKRRRTKREGPPQLQFLVATDPSQFRDEDAKRSVRSQAMIHWRHEEDKKRKVDEKGRSALEARSNSDHDASTRYGQTATVPIRARGSQSIRFRGEDVPQSQHVTSYDELYPPGWSSETCQSTGIGSSSWQLTASETAIYFPHYMRSKVSKKKAVIHYEQSEIHEERQLWKMISGLATFYNIGGLPDPFEVLPQFRNPQLNALWLSRNCMRGFASDQTVKKWLPLLLSHPHIILSSTVLASTWLDMNNNLSGDSTTTTMVKAEIIGMIKERLNDPRAQLDNLTLITILHLFAGEMWACSETALRTHENGLATLITRRGGLSTFVEDRTVAEVALANSYHCNIFCETEILPAFSENLPDITVIDNETALPESPLYCPRHSFLTISHDPQCSPSILELLYDMRDLTDIFVAHDTALNKIHDVDAVDIARLSPPNEAYEATIQTIRTRMSLLPSAHTPGTAVSGDWVYESCRIAAIIYSTAITMRVPFSIAADPRYTDTGSSFASWSDENHLPKAHLSEVLHETLERSNTSNMWTNMSGVLYWVSAVGAAAARRPQTLDMTQRVRFGPDAYAVWTRRCLIMTATRTMIVLVFEQPTAVIAAQRKLLKVQELIGSHASRRLET